MLVVDEDRDKLAVSSDGGYTWARHDQPEGITRLGGMHATENFLLADGLTSNLSSDWELFQFDVGTNIFTGIRDRLPADFAGRFTSAHKGITVSPATDTITLTDGSSFVTPERSALYTTDGGETFHQLYWHEAGGDDEGFELRRALAVNEHLAFIVEQSSRDTRIRATCDGGLTWHTVEERRTGPTHIYNLVADHEGHVHALWTGAAGTQEIMRLTK